MRRRELLAKDTTIGSVDLGLSVKWAEGNIVKNMTRYSIGAPTDRGCYFSWGRIIGYNKGEGYDFSEDVYKRTSASAIAADISPTSGYDAARATLGGNWRLPTKDEFKELYNNTDRKWISNYNGSGVNGFKFMKKSDNSVYIFLPASGYYYLTTLYNEGKYGYYWSSTYQDSDYAYSLDFLSTYVRPEGYDDRYYGFSVRAVQ